jgi:hypothetical protein
MYGYILYMYICYKYYTYINMYNFQTLDTHIYHLIATAYVFAPAPWCPDPEVIPLSSLPLFPTEDMSLSLWPQQLEQSYLEDQCLGETKVNSWGKATIKLPWLGDGKHIEYLYGKYSKDIRWINQYRGYQLSGIYQLFRCLSEWWMAIVLRVWLFLLYSSVRIREVLQLPK